MNYIISERMMMRPVSHHDHAALGSIFGDPEVMYAWGGAFSDDDVTGWINKNLRWYEDYGYGCCIAFLKNSAQVAGIIGPVMESIEDAHYPGVGYIVARELWNLGYATEGARAALEYARLVIGATKVVAAIKDTNLPSRRVAEKIGMSVERTFIRTWKGVDMTHLMYSISE